MIYLYDNEKKIIGTLEDNNIKSNKHTKVLNGNITVSLEGLNEPTIKEATYVGMKDEFSSNNFLRYKISRLEVGSGTFRLDGIHEFFDDLQTKNIIKERRFNGKSASEILPIILEGTGWEFELKDALGLGNLSLYYTDSLSAFDEFINRWNVEYKIRMYTDQGDVVRKVVEIHKTINQGNPIWYETKDKVLKVLAEQDNDIYTAFIGRGSGIESGDGYSRKITLEDVVWSKNSGNPLDKPKGQNYLLFPEANQLYGHEDGTPRFEVVDFEGIDDYDELIQATYEYGLKHSRPQKQYSVTIHDTGETLLGGDVIVVDTVDDIRFKSRIFKIVYDFKNTDNKQFEFGDKIIKTFNDRVKESVDKEVNIITDIGNPISPFNPNYEHSPFNPNSLSSPFNPDNPNNIIGDVGGGLSTEEVKEIINEYLGSTEDHRDGLIINDGYNLSTEHNSVLTYDDSVQKKVQLSVDTIQPYNPWFSQHNNALQLTADEDSISLFLTDPTYHYPEPAGINNVKIGHDLLSTDKFQASQAEIFEMIPRLFYVGPRFDSDPKNVNYFEWESAHYEIKNLAGETTIKRGIGLVYNGYNDSKNEGVKMGLVFAYDGLYFLNVKGDLVKLA